MPDRARIDIAARPADKALMFRCAGPCTMGACPAIRAQIEAQQAGEIEDVYFDLSAVESIDSTFAGFLLAQLRTQQRDGSPHLHLVAPSTGVMRTLETMHVLRLLDIVDALPAPSANWRELAIEAPDANQAADLVISCHEKLIDADERNRKTFGQVVDGFRKARDGDRHA